MKTNLLIAGGLFLFVILVISLSYSNSANKDTCNQKFPCTNPLNRENCGKEFPCTNLLNRENCGKEFPCTNPLNRENCSKEFPCPGPTGLPLTLENCRTAFSGPTCPLAANQDNCKQYVTLENCQNSFTGPTGCNVLNNITCATVKDSTPLSIGSRVYYSYRSTTEDIKADIEYTRKFLTSQGLPYKSDEELKFTTEKDIITIYGIITSISDNYATIKPFIINIKVDCLTNINRPQCYKLPSNPIELIRSQYSNKQLAIHNLFEQTATPSIANHLNVPLSSLTKADNVIEDKINMEVWNPLNELNSVNCQPYCSCVCPECPSVNSNN